MDEISILQYSRCENAVTGQVSCNKLVLLDFLDEATILEEKPPAPLTSSLHTCLNCDKTGESFKFCSHCHKVQYCSVQCQRANWTYHKMDCFQ